MWKYFVFVFLMGVLGGFLSYLRMEKANNDKELDKCNLLYSVISGGLAATFLIFIILQNVKLGLYTGLSVSALAGIFGSEIIEYLRDKYLHKYLP